MTVTPLQNQMYFRSRSENTDCSRRSACSIVHSATSTTSVPAYTPPPP